MHTRDEYSPTASADDIRFLLKTITAKRPKSAKKLLSAAVAYFEQATDTQLPNATGRATPRPWTLDGFLLSADLTRTDWRRYREQVLFRRVCERIEMLIRTQKFELATTGAFNSAIVIRDLELVDKTDTTSGGEALPGIFVRKIVDSWDD